MKIFALTLLMVLGCHHSSANDYMGFFPPQTFGDKIAKAGESVFKVKIPSGQLVAMIVDKTPDELKVGRDLFAQAGDYHKAGQLDYCIDYTLDPCLVMDNLGEGSAFLMGNGSTLWTAQHGILDYIENLQKAMRLKYPGADEEAIMRYVKAYPLPMKVTNSKNEKVDLSDGKFIHSLSLRELKGFPFKQESFPFLENDIVGIRLGHAIGTPLEMAPEPAQLGDAIYLLGYPMSTGFEREIGFGKPDSNGKQLYASAGVALSLDTTLTRLSPRNSPVRDFHDLVKASTETYTQWSDALYFVEVDVEQGNSGGPALNDKGQVVGIVSAFSLEHRGENPSLTHAIIKKIQAPAEVSASL